MSWTIIISRRAIQQILQYFSNIQFHWKYSILSDQNWFNCIDSIQYLSTLSITSITSILRTLRNSQLSIYLFIFAISFIYRIYFTMSKYLREFYHSVRMTISSFTTHSFFSNRASKIVCKHSKNAFIIIFIFAIISTFDFLFFSFVFCDHVFDDHSMT